MAPAILDCGRSLGACSTAIRCPLCPPDTVEHRSSYRNSVRGSDHVTPDWSIGDHMQSSKQDVTSDIIAYYV
ncbi:unnamed protein product [Staurois parvus]|uniref:Uncharacterized protein n=1 Tax=Staurois parvus TaxID=386267 RepID=A0ABN9ATR0_9NEOB|nr:unnamed protein product [Staurois parvus]